VLLGPITPASAQVCGIDLSTVEAFDWQTFSDGRGSEGFAKRNALQVFAALREDLIPPSRRWPREFAEEVFDQFEKLASGRSAPSDWTISAGERGRGSLIIQGFVFGGDRRIWLPTEADEDECREGDTMRHARAEFAAFVELVERSVSTLANHGVDPLYQRIVALEAEYDRYLFEGFPMFPWEAAVNSWFLTDEHIANGPPRWQLAVVHPSAGVIGHVDTGTEGDLGASLLVEAIGIVRYTDDLRHWYGASVIASFPFDREPGIGVALNYDRFKLGVTWHDDPSGEYDGAAILLGIDLFQFVGQQRKTYDGYRKKLEGLLDSGQGTR
jgi:hypothetical protein